MLQGALLVQGKWWSDDLQQKTEETRENLFQCHVVHQKSHKWQGNKLRTLGCEAASSRQCGSKRCLLTE
jgi:hypothetical protein